MRTHLGPGSMHACVVCARSYIGRRAMEGFREGAAERDPAKLGQLWTHANEQHELMQRQSLVYGMYARKIKNILVRFLGLGS